MIELPKTIAANIEYFTGRTWLLPTVLDWFEKSSERMFILTGGPGTGKSMIMAWLAGHGPWPIDTDAVTQLASIRQSVKASHFCIADSGNISPKAMAENIAKQLQISIPLFNEALSEVLKTKHAKQEINIVQQVGKVQAGAVIELIGMKIEFKGISDIDERAFNMVLREPLQKLAELGYQEPIILLVDALDEALTYSCKPTIVRMLAKDVDIPPNVRFLATSRDDPRVKVQFSNRNYRAFDLIKDGSLNVNETEVRLFAFERLSFLHEPARTKLAARISQQAAGVFLYANMVLQQLLPNLTTEVDIDSLDLPKDLVDLYRGFLARELTADSDLWFRLYGPLLGLLAVARGEGLSRDLLEQILGEEETTEALLKCKQYVTGDLPFGPFRLFHYSFVEFLLDKKKNVSYPLSAAANHRRIIMAYQKAYRGRWEEIDPYGASYLLEHLVEVDSEGKLNALSSYEKRHLFEHLLAAERASYIGKVIDLVYQP